MIKRRKLEILVLSLGGLVILSALFLRFATDLPPDRKLIFTNIVFALGFLVYIAYSILSTNNLNREIRALNNEVVLLKKDILEKEKLLEERQERVNLLEGELSDSKKTISELEEDLAASKKENSALEKQISDLRTSKKEAKP